MGPKYRFSIEAKNGYISVTSEGLYSTQMDLMDITVHVHQKAKETGVRYFLLDFVRTSFKLPLAEAYNLVRTYDLSMPAFAGGVAACVYSEPSKEFVKYWRDVGCQRGYDIEMFTESEKAEGWLIDRSKSKG